MATCEPAPAAYQLAPTWPLPGFPLPARPFGAALAYRVPALVPCSRPPCARGGRVTLAEEPKEGSQRTGARSTRRTKAGACAIRLLGEAPAIGHCHSPSPAEILLHNHR